MHWRLHARLWGLVVLPTSCTGDDGAATDSVRANNAVAAIAPDPTDGEWRMQAKYYRGWRYSGLAQIDGDRGNAARIVVVLHRYAARP